MLSRKQLILACFTLVLLATPTFTKSNRPGCTHDHQKHPEPEVVDPITDGLDQKGRLLAASNSTTLTDFPQMRIYPSYAVLSNDTTWSNYVQNSLIPPIISYFQGALRPRYPLGTTFQMGPGTICGVSVPMDLQNGVAADYYWFIADADDTVNAWVASSYACNILWDSNRPYIGMTTINRPWLTPTNDILYHERNIVCIMHEFTHVLGFSWNLYWRYRDINMNFLQNVSWYDTLDNTTTVVLNVEPLTTRLRNHYGCASLSGAFMENSGGGGSYGSHFERRHFGNEMMTSGEMLEMAVSEFTLALLEGTGWYLANYSYAEPLSFGMGQGCSFLFGNCSASGFQSQFSEFCTPNVGGCTTAGRSGGDCYADPNSDWCQFQHSDYNYHCENPLAKNNARFPGFEVYGRGAGSKCFAGTLSPSTTAKNNINSAAFCLTYTCVPPPVISPDVLGAFGTRTTYRLIVNLGTKTATCNRAGPITVPGFAGTLNCPDPTEYCTTVGSKTCIRNCSGQGNCVNGVCVCNSGFSGEDCAIGPLGIWGNGTASH